MSKELVGMGEPVMESTDDPMKVLRALDTKANELTEELGELVSKHGERKGHDEFVIQNFARLQGRIDEMESLIQSLKEKV